MGIRHIFRQFRDWMANSRPPWAAYRALMLGYLIDHRRLPLVRSVCVGDTWHWMLMKCIMAVTEAEAKEACRTE